MTTALDTKSRQGLEAISCCKARAPRRRSTKIMPDQGMPESRLASTSDCKAGGGVSHTVHCVLHHRM